MCGSACQGCVVVDGMYSLGAVYIIIYMSIKVNYLIAIVKTAFMVT